MVNISKYLKSDDKFIVKIIKMAQSTKDYHMQGKLTNEEYSNNLENIEMTYEVEVLSSNIERKKLLSDAINIIRSILPVLI